MTAAAPRTDPSSGRRLDGAGPELLPLLAVLQDAFHAGVDGADLAAPVPACGRWRVKNLVNHLARIHHWAAGQVRRQQETPLGRGPFDLAPFYAAQAAELREVLAQTPPDATSWTLTGTGPASFWHRRQVHETLVHLHDQRAAALGSGAAVGQDGPIDVGPEVWADAVDEVVTMFAPRQVRLGRAVPPRRAVTLVAADVGADGWSWVLGGTDQQPAATLSAPARELALILWGRLDLAETGATVHGDLDAVTEALGARIVP